MTPAELRRDAKMIHGELVELVVPHAPILHRPFLKALLGRVFALLDNIINELEKKQNGG